MFETSDRRPLEEHVFEEWLEKGRSDRMGFHYLIVVWNAFDREYQPVYRTSREEAEAYQPGLQEHQIAIYDLYSESRIEVRNDF